MATIKPIEGRTVHQIQSGQVIVDLCSVVKELVENSLDAGATTIDIRFKNQGLDSIEVQDNGDGISSNNYDTIALKHYTSKLSTYADLTTLQTFGFRGEALSSLCALSKFSITTCMAQDAPKGTKLEFETSGKLAGTVVVAAQKGTTVVVEDLFNNLPVRRKELERNIKREWNRVVSVLGQYACIQTGIKFSVSQQPARGKKTTLFSTKGNQSTRENIVNVFGAKTLTTLIALDLKLELEPTSGPSQRWSTQEDGGKKDIRIIGHISRPASGEGRQTPDRQMFFVNARPCGLPQVAKAFNEVYRSYNGSQSPFIFANIELDTHLYDVNVSPDKRTILLHDQSQMLENLKTALTALFESQDYTVPISQLPAQKQPSYKQLTISRESTVRAQTPLTTPQTQAESVAGDEPEKEDRRSLPDEDIGEGKLGESSSTGMKPPGLGAFSRESLDRDNQAVSLISNWVGKDSEDRVIQMIPARHPRRLGSGRLSKDKRLLVEKLKREALQRQHAAANTDDLDSGSAASPPRISASPDEEPAEDISESQSEADDYELSARGPLEPPIPALRSPARSSTAVSNTFSSSKRPFRSTGELATITIGEHTVTSSIGTPCPKRSRIENPASGTQSAGRSGLPKAALPSFGSRLSQRFAAPGTQMTTPSGEDDEEGDPEAVEEDQDPQKSDSESASETEEIEEEESAEPISDQAMIDADVDIPMLEQDDDNDDDYVDEAQKKTQEEAKVQKMIKAAEDFAAQPSQENAERAKALLKGGSKKKDATLNLLQIIDTSIEDISEHIRLLDDATSVGIPSPAAAVADEALDSDTAEEKLSLTISKTDFAKMKIIGQFNLGFILASRAPVPGLDGRLSNRDEVFIIDQHASDEKYNFERLQATTIVQSQPLVSPKTLELTAMEEEIVMENLRALETNGFIVKIDETGDAPVGQRCQLVSLPSSRETTFSLTDLEELLALLAENPPGAVPRPSKVRKMFAMRACRSSIMIGRTLTLKQMGKVVQHLGELDKPWNCPHGRPTMRHLCGLERWDTLGWEEGDGLDGEKGEPTNWTAYVQQNSEDISEPASP